MELETIAVHAGGEPDSETGALAAPIHLATTFEVDADSTTPRGYRYVRDGNPTETRLETALAALDGGEASLVFGSGMAAVAGLVQTLQPGDHLILPTDGYYACRVLGRDFASRWGVTHDLVDLTDIPAVERAMRPGTRIIWAETPSNPSMKIVDIEAIARIASAAGARLVVDNTFATPMLQRPLDLGADIVHYSTTKYFGGHSDVQGGALVVRLRDSLFEELHETRRILGAVASPFNSWLVLRGIRTLAARMRVHCENGMAVARFLESHSRVARTNYPGLDSHESHALASRQMKGYGGMISFLVDGSKADAIEIVSRTRIFTRATSLGGVESLIEHRASSEGSGSTTAENLIRLSVGLEHQDDLIEDLRRALGS